ncbi:MAG: acetyl-CoA hydrolase/transferase C-terminal domain-containing protein [Porphyromonadaceae bacterium]|nr:acetyl-CoA hydrolase/transferase C-terminal domain-containing protein [Porphyromonadaceae bacterium]
MNTDWQLIYRERCTTALEAVRRGIDRGQHLVFGHAAAAPTTIAEAMFELRDELSDLKIFHMIYMGEPWHLRPEMAGCVQPMLNFLDKGSRVAYRECRADFIPCHFHELPDLFVLGLYPVDVAIVQLSLPNAEGYCSFGVSNDYTKAAAEHASVIIAEVNDRMPFIGGDNLIHVSQLDYIVEVSKPLPAVPAAPIGDIERQIAAHCAPLIRDGDTLQLGIGAIPDAVLQSLHGRKDLGIHTEMFTDGVMHLIRSGQINGKRKTLHPGKVVTTLVMGSEELYEFLDHNEMIEMYPVSYTNDPYIIAQNDRLISINSCLEIDLTGQVASEAIGLNQFSGTGGQVDFLRGAKRSKGGLSILAMRSTAQGDTISRIVPVLSEGANVTAGRNEVDYIVTEHGCVRLRGLSLRHRAEALVSIAHPQFRPMLQDAIGRRFYAKS